MEGGFYKGVWYPTQHSLHQAQMFDLAASSNMPVHPHFQSIPHQFPQVPRGRFRSPFPHRGHPRPNLIPIHPTRHGHLQAGFLSIQEPPENPSEHQVLPHNTEIPMRVPQSTQSDVNTQNYVGPTVVNIDQQPASLHYKQRRSMMRCTDRDGACGNWDQNPDQNQQQSSDGGNVQPETRPQQHHEQQRERKSNKKRPGVDGDSAVPLVLCDYNPYSNLQQSSSGDNFQPETGSQQLHKQKKTKKLLKNKPWVDGDSSENGEQNADSNQDHGNFQHEMPPRYQKQHRYRHDETEYHQQTWGRPVPNQNYNHHRGRGRGYRGQHPRNNNYKPRYQFDGHSTPQTEHKDGGENQQAERNSDLLQEPAPLESPAMVDAAVSPEKTAEENSCCEAIVNDIINSTAPEERPVIVETPEEGPVIVQTPGKIPATAELPDLSYIYTMNLAELRSLCLDICSECKNFWGPLEVMPHMVTKIETVIEILPHKCKDQSKVDVLVQDMQHCLSLLESRAPMIESAAGKVHCESSESDREDDLLIFIPRAIQDQQSAALHCGQDGRNHQTDGNEHSLWIETVLHDRSPSSERHENNASDPSQPSSHGSNSLQSQSTELPQNEFGYIDTMNLAELQILCTDIFNESQSFWGPLELLPEMQNKIERVINILPRKTELLVQDLKQSLSLLKHRTSMIASAHQVHCTSSSQSEDEVSCRLLDLTLGQQTTAPHGDQDGSKNYESLHNSAQTLSLDQSHSTVNSSSAAGKFRQQHKPKPLQFVSKKRKTKKGGKGIGKTGAGPQEKNEPPDEVISQHKTLDNLCRQDKLSDKISDLLQEQTQIESDAMVAALPSTNVPMENSLKKQEVLSSTPAVPEIQVVLLGKNQTDPGEDLSYIDTMNLAELLSLCTDICKESKNFWGPLEMMPQMQNKIERVIDTLPRKANELVLKMKNCFMLLRKRASMIQSASNAKSCSSESGKD